MSQKCNCKFPDIQSKTKRCEGEWETERQEGEEATKTRVIKRERSEKRLELKNRVCVRVCVCVYSVCARANEMHNSVVLGETFLGAKTGTLIRMQRPTLLFGLLLRCFVSDFIGPAILSACTHTHMYGQRKLMEQQRRKHTRTQNPCVSAGVR